MKVSKVSILLFGAALLSSSAVLAGDTNKGNLNLSDKVVVDGKPLGPGNYKVEWDGSGPAVQVRLIQGKQTVATLPAHLTEQTSPNEQNAYGTAAEPDGSLTLTAIYPGGKRVALQFDQNQANTQQPSR
jgi:hypothetical protein